LKVAGSAIYKWRVDALGVAVMVVGFIILTSGCTLLSWGSKPDCPKPQPCPSCPPAKVVTVEKACELPPPITLPAVTRSDCGAGSGLVACFDVPNAALLAQREAALKDWIRETRARCGVVPPTNGVGAGTAR